MQTAPYPQFEQELAYAAEFYVPYKKRPEQLRKFLLPSFEQKKRLQEYFKLGPDYRRTFNSDNAEHAINSLLGQAHHTYLMNNNRAIRDLMNVTDKKQWLQAWTTNQWQDEHGRQATFTKWLHKNFSKNWDGSHDMNDIMSTIRQSVGQTSKGEVLFLSANPIDVLLMSANCNYNSCMAPTSGHYPGGPFSYNRDTITMIAYTTVDGKWNSKKTNRVMLYLTPDGQGLVVGQPYHGGSGWNRDTATAKIRSMLQELELPLGTKTPSRPGSFTSFRGAAAKNDHGSGSSSYFDIGVSAVIGNIANVLQFTDGVQCPNCEKSTMKSGHGGACSNCAARGFFTHKCIKCSAQCYGIEVAGKGAACETCFKTHFQQNCTHCKVVFTPDAETAKLNHVCAGCRVDHYEDLKTCGYTHKQNIVKVFNIQGQGIDYDRRQVPDGYYVSQEEAHQANVSRTEWFESQIQSLEERSQNSHKEVFDSLAEFQITEVREEFFWAVLSDLENQIISTKV